MRKKQGLSQAELLGRLRNSLWVLRKCYARRWTLKHGMARFMDNQVPPSSHADMLALNQVHQVETSALDMAALQRMLGTAFYADVAGGGADGFIIAFDQDADYDSPNFVWFQARYDRFVYVDRIIVATHARGQGLARSFYTKLFTYARGAGHRRVVCEINIDPPNPGSLAFHLALGFVELAQVRLGNGKTVSYQECLL
jgi:uncharacterized protein